MKGERIDVKPQPRPEMVEHVRECAAYARNYLWLIGYQLTDDEWREWTFNAARLDTPDVTDEEIELALRP